MVSVCMSVKNGESFLEAQVASILPQLNSTDELIVCDDHSTDSSLAILETFNDNRIRALSTPGSGIVNSFGHALSNSQGDFIFLADQDDIWAPHKIKRMSEFLISNDLVVCDCALIDEEDQIRMESFFEWNRSGTGLFRNLFRNSYMGCCMAFTRRVKDMALPFPVGIAMHDYWIGLISEIYFQPIFVHEPLVLHRKHGRNHSTTGKASQQSLSRKISQRIQLITSLVGRTYA